MTYKRMRSQNEEKSADDGTNSNILVMICGIYLDRYTRTEI